MHVPHIFPSIISGNLRPVLIIGAGLSIEEIKPTDIIDNLKVGIPPSSIACDTCSTPNECLYCVAQARLNEIQAGPNNGEHARFLLAKEMGLFDDGRWMGRFEMRLGRNHMRHRMIARLAADRRLEAIVSLNWDCILEAAFEAIGIQPQPQTVGRPGLVTDYATVVRHRDQGPQYQRHTFPIFKPHGCRRDLEETRRTRPNDEPVFIITRGDLENQKSHPNPLVSKEIGDRLKLHPLVGAGWRAVERYLLDLISGIGADLPKTTPDDRLSIIAKEWDTGHGELAKPEAYASSKELSMCEIGGDRDTDRLFAWIFARYALSQLRNISSASGIPTLLQSLDEIIEQLSEPLADHDHTFLAFFDNYLPAWSRICAHAGITEFWIEGNPFPAHRIPLGPGDWHVPLDTAGNGNPFNQRPDLAAAAHLLCATEQSSWNFSSFPGALWKEAERVLVIPMPIVGASSNSINAIAAYKPLVADWRRTANFARIDNIRLLLLNQNGDQSADANDAETLRANYAAGLARHFPTARIGATENPRDSSPELFSLIRLNELKEVP